MSAYLEYQLFLGTFEPMVLIGFEPVLRGGGPFPIPLGINLESRAGAAETPRMI